MTGDTAPPARCNRCAQRLTRTSSSLGMGGWLRRLALGSLLEDPLGFFQLAFVGRGQILARAIDEVLDHPNARTDPLRPDLFAGHGPGDRFGVLVERVPLGKQRNVRMVARRPMSVAEEHARDPRVHAACPDGVSYSQTFLLSVWDSPWHAACTQYSVS